VKDESIAVEWVLLTTGDRPEAHVEAVQSVLLDGGLAILVANGCGSDGIDVPAEVAIVESGRNLGVPGGRDLGVRESGTPIVGFLDDDAILGRGATERICEVFAADDRVGAVSLHLVDEAGVTARRHVPRRGSAGAGESGEVVTFLGGASAIRRAAYNDVGGYFTDLFYGHEELELSWRLIDAGWSIRYLADVDVFHPKTDISRHADGWRLTGRNRVWIARRTLPWAIAIVHVISWLFLGLVRAPSGCRCSYAMGWLLGWRGNVGRNPIRWSTVRRLGQLGRLPIC